MLIDLDLKDQKVLIIGGGNVACRKAKEYLSYQAKVFLLSQDIKEELHSLPITILQQSYTKEVLQDCFLVHVATNDAILNENIVQDCASQKMLCICATASSAHAHSILNMETDDVCMGIGTKGSYPALNRILLQRFMNIYETEYADKMPYLSSIRSLLLSSNNDKNRIQERLKQLPQESIAFLAFLEEALTLQKASLMVFHGVKNIASIKEEILPFLKDRTMQSKTPCYFAYLSTPVIREINKESHQVFSLYELIELLSLCKVSITLYPMLMQGGRYHQMVLDAAGTSDIKQLPFSNVEQLQKLMDTIHKEYHQQNHTLLILYHSSENGAFSQLIKRINLPKDTLICSEKAMDIMDPQQFQHNVIVYSLLMLSGYHMKEDGQRIQDHLAAHKVTFIQQSCIKDPCIRTLFSL